MQPLNYVIRRIDPELWKAVKARAAKEGRPIRFVILGLLQLYAERGYKVVEAANHKPRRR